MTVEIENLVNFVEIFRAVREYVSEKCNEKYHICGEPYIDSVKLKGLSIEVEGRLDVTCYSVTESEFFDYKISLEELEKIVDKRKIV